MSWKLCFTKYTFFFFLHLHIIRWSKYQLSTSLGFYIMHLLFLLLSKTTVNGSVTLPFSLQISENPWLRKQEVLCKAASAQRGPASIHDHPSCLSTCVGTRCSNRASTGLKVGRPGFCLETFNSGPVSLGFLCLRTCRCGLPYGFRPAAGFEHGKLLSLLQAVLFVTETHERRHPFG